MSMELERRTGRLPAAGLGLGHSWPASDVRRWCGETVAGWGGDEQHHAAVGSADRGRLGLTARSACSRRTVGALLGAGQRRKASGLGDHRQHRCGPRSLRRRAFHAARTRRDPARKPDHGRDAHAFVGQRPRPEPFDQRRFAQRVPAVPRPADCGRGAASRQQSSTGSDRVGQRIRADSGVQPPLLHEARHSDPQSVRRPGPGGHEPRPGKSEPRPRGRSDRPRDRLPERPVD